MIKNLYNVSLILVIVGAVNWGLIGVFRFNLVELLFGIDTVPSRIVYALVGISGLFAAIVRLGLFNKKHAN